MVYRFFFNTILIIYVYFTFLMINFYHFSYKLLKEIFLRFVTNSFCEVELFKYIYRVQRLVCVFTVYFFWSIDCILLEAKNVPYDIWSFPRNIICVQTCFVLSNCRTYSPSMLKFRCAKAKWEETLFVDSS